jgi:hypothetical protein
MPNHVTHKIIFTADHHDAAKIFSEACDGKTLAFNRFVPRPLSAYLGDVSTEDQEDFKCNWLSWNRENWGTKWDAYTGDTGYSFDSRIAFIQFDTAWSIPYPIIAAFANRFQIAFEHRYFDEGGNFWGIEKWGRSKYGGEVMSRIEKRKNHTDDARPLCIELKGYDPEQREEEEF